MSALERTFTALALAMTLAPIGGTELAAASLDPRTLASVPVRYSAGDEVVIQASIVPEAGERLAPLDLKPGAGLAAQGEEADPELRELTLSKTSDGWLLALRFVPWSPGAGTIPEMRLKGVRIPALHYAAVSLIGPDDRDPSPPRSQRSPPGIALYLYGFAGLLIAARRDCRRVHGVEEPTALRFYHHFGLIRRTLDRLVAEVDHEEGHSTAPS